MSSPHPERSHVVVILDGEQVQVWGTYTATGAEQVAPLLAQMHPGARVLPTALRARHIPLRHAVP